ncbi:dihydropyrimidine dehydrogenase subunit A [Rubripirellula tenax]|uniref:Dihydropyrimidine dehydrogenase subunit A n=1 Tax=Rubripirellula tenax TaxID=2528015 RepID=A0A5C6EM37_9BACT|nr:hypothetical protein [Rubripirellula tenax]TWU50813.1 dihydropyrimidine dehydrogenase subunit A [Rubripirellula tenax]
MQNEEIDDSPTLDPPGSIAVIGAGPLGIEAALYGRFMGYDVTVFEAVAVANSHRNHDEEPLPMLPDRSLSPLAVSALQAQQPELVPALPMTYGQWIENGLEMLLQTDLLRDRLRCPAKVTRIETVAVEADEPDEDTSDVPPDFRLTLSTPYGGDETFDAESVIVVTGIADAIELGFALPADYFFAIGKAMAGEPLSETTFLTGLKEIVATYASLAGRSTLDLYRPRRG